jgi:hypothetical protein
MNNKEKVKEIIKELKISSVDDMNLLAEEMDINKKELELLNESTNNAGINKENIIKMINNEIDIPRDKFFVGSGSALVLHGVKDYTNDIDLVVENDYFFNELSKKYKIESAKFNGKRIEINNDIECFNIDSWAPEVYDYETETVEGLQVETLESIKKWKEIFGRDKDLLDIQLINKSLNESTKIYGKCQLCGKKRKWENDGESCPNCGHDHIIHLNE